MALAPRTQKAAWTWAKGFIRSLQEADYWPSSYGKGINDHRLPTSTPDFKISARNRLDGKGVQVPTPDHLDRFLRHVKNTPITSSMIKGTGCSTLKAPELLVDCADVLEVMAYTGMRRDCEAQASLRWERIEWKQDPRSMKWKAKVHFDVDKLKRSYGKTIDRHHALTLPQEASDPLRRIYERHGQPTEGRVLTCSMDLLGRRLKVWSKAWYAEVEGFDDECWFTFHGSFRPFATRFAQRRGWAEWQLDAYFGNSPKTRKKHYMAESHQMMDDWWDDSPPNVIQMPPTARGERNTG